jgi:hypothetical protein
MSILIKEFLSLNIISFKAFADSVLPTHVFHRNKKLPRGFHSSFNQAFALLIASEILFIAYSCHTTFLLIYSSNFRSFSFSVTSNFCTGIPVHLPIISAISSSVTLSFKKLCQLL